MSPLDMLVFLFFALITIKAAVDSVAYWREVDEEIAEAETERRAVRASLSRTVRTGKPSSVRVTPIKRERIPAITASSCVKGNNKHYQLKDKGAA